MTTYTNTLLSTIVVCCTAINATAQKPADSLAAKKPVAYEKVITDKVKSQHGMFIIHQLEDNYYLEIPDSLLNRDILMVNRLAKSSIEGLNSRFATYGGDKIDERVISFERGPGNKVFMRGKSYAAVSRDSSDNGMFRSLLNSSVQSILAAFTVKTRNEKNPATVIDVTSLINADNPLFTFPGFYKKLRNIAAQQNDRSYIISMSAYPRNIEIRTLRTFATINPLGSGFVSYELNNSLVLLPKVPMQARLSDRRIGYFSSMYTDFDGDPQGVKKNNLIHRWRMEPKATDRKKYFRGELVEPQKQIVFYIDPATPKKWVPYLIQGVNDWQAAFEKAGFKNAIIAKEAPANDNTWSLEDATHSAIVYKPSEEKNASGPHIHDPRSGEILESHINWYHNVMRLVQGWYMIQAGAIDPNAGKMQLDDKLMGDLIRFVSSHEVGHTLGLAHNYGSSSTVPSELLRNKAFVEANGHTPSIMDYARFNYVAQPEDHIGKKGIYPRIGDYDKWAIEWGYKLMEGKTSREENSILSKIATERLKNNRLWFGPENNYDDPRSQNEDLGDNAMISGGYGIKNMKRIVAKLQNWTKSDREGHEDLENMYDQLTKQFSRYMGHAAKNIGGIMATPKPSDEAGTVYKRATASTQKEAMDFLDQQLFSTPRWLLLPGILDNVGKDPLTVISKLQDPVLARLLSKNTLSKLTGAEAADGPTAYKITDLLTDMNTSIFKELYTNFDIDIYRRNLQKAYVSRLITLLKAPIIPAGSQEDDEKTESFQNDVISVVKAELKNLAATIKLKSAAANGATKFHLDDLSDRINACLDRKM